MPLHPFLQIAGALPFSMFLGGKSKAKNKTLKKRKSLKKTIRKKNLSRKKETKRKNFNKKKTIRKRITTNKKRKCNCDHSKYYKGDEPSPKGLGNCAHCSPLNITMKGLDGNLWENQKYKKGKRWIKIREDVH